MDEINVSRLIDTSKLRSFHWWVAFWCLLAIMADGFDLLNASIAGPALIKEWGISRAALGPVFSMSFFGFFIGAPFFGYLGDRFGRKQTIVISLICLGLATFACAFAADLQELLWLRFLSGIGLGGVIPNVIALNSEYAPKHLRATFLVVISMGISLGGSIPGIVGVTLMPAYGWPVIFIVGGIVPIVVGLLMIFAIPESIKFLVLRGGRDDTVRRLVQRINPAVAVTPATKFVLDADEGNAKTRGSVVELFRGGWAAITLLLWLIFVLNLMANNLLNAWLPMIVQTGGHSAEQGAYAGTLYQLGGSFGGLVIGVFIDLIGLKVIAFVFAIAVVVVAFTGTPGITGAMLLVMAFLSGCVVTGMQNALNAGAGLIYPTSLRANGVGYALGIGRVGSISGPLLGSLLARMEMPTSAYFYVTAIGPLCCAIFAVLLLRRLADKRRDDPAGLAAAGA